MTPRIIIVGGIPGTGKTTLATEISRRLGIAYFNKDLLESTLISNDICSIKELNGVGYALMERIALSELKLGHSVILDCVASYTRVNEHWTSFKAKDIRYIECICSDQKLHKTRLESRERNIPNWYELTWGDIETIIKSYEPCFEARLNVDSIKPLKENIKSVIKYVSS